MINKIYTYFIISNQNNTVWQCLQLNVSTDLRGDRSKIEVLEVVRTNFETIKDRKRIYRTSCVHLTSPILTFPDIGVVMVSILTRTRFSDFEIRPKTTSPSWSRNGKSRCPKK